jgi:DNA recombination protein RmuC
MELVVILIIGALAAVSLLTTALYFLEKGASSLSAARVEDLQNQLDNERSARRAEQEAATLDREKRAREESRVLERLAPVSENIAKMQHKMESLEEQRKIQHLTLEQMMKQTQTSEKELRQITDRLASTLTKGQARGTWGEMQLKNLFETVGMTSHVDFDMQVDGVVDGQKVRPDAVVRLPDGKSIPIDSKVPFDAFYKASSIPDTADEAELARRESLLNEHVKALRGHIDALSSKKYWEAMRLAPDFVIAFIPSESLLAGALEKDPSILEYAFQKRVALASPVTLWSVLKSVAYAWNQAERESELDEFIRVAKDLYKNISVVAKHSTDLAKNLGKTVESYNKYASSLERNFLTNARRLNKLDLSIELQTPEQIELQSRDFTKEELREEVT